MQETSSLAACVISAVGQERTMKRSEVHGGADIAKLPRLLRRFYL